MTPLRFQPSRNAAKPIACLAVAAFAGLAVTARAESKSEIQQLKSTMAEMEKTMEAMKKRIQQLEAGQKTTSTPAPAPAASKSRKTSAPAAAPAIAAAPSAPAGLSDRTSRMKHRETIAGDNIPAPRPGNAPIDPTYAGFTPLSGTNTWVKLGGYAKVDAIADTTLLSNPNKFVTNGIPVRGDANFGRASEFNLHAKQTRLNLELRSPTPLGSLRIVYENDFFASSTSQDMDYNLRHFYGQVANFTVGQTWTAFFDPDAIPDTLDFQGPGVQSIVRQPQLRYTFSPFSEHQHIGFSVEQPKSDVGGLPANATTRNTMPDFTAYWRWEGERGHIQTGGLLRSLAYENPAGGDHTTLGWGVNVSGVLHTWGNDSIVARFTYGDGIGRYMQDLPGGSSAIVLADGSLETLTAWGAMAGYRHFWNDHWRSEFTYGYVNYDSRPEQGGKAYDHTHYAQANIVWAATPNFSIGLEYLYGLRSTSDGSDGDAHRVQLSMQYKLVR